MQLRQRHRNSLDIRSYFQRLQAAYHQHLGRSRFRFHSGLLVHRTPISSSSSSGKYLHSHPRHFGQWCTLIKGVGFEGCVSITYLDLHDASIKSTSNPLKRKREDETSTPLLPKSPIRRSKIAPLRKRSLHAHHDRNVEPNVALPEKSTLPIPVAPVMFLPRSLSRRSKIAPLRKRPPHLLPDRNLEPNSALRAWCPYALLHFRYNTACLRGFQYNSFLVHAGCKPGDLKEYVVGSHNNTSYCCRASGYVFHRDLCGDLSWILATGLGREPRSRTQEIRCRRNAGAWRS
jgi:hypothetical protein